MHDPIRRKLDEHAARHVPATTDLWPALQRRVAGRKERRGLRHGWRRVLAGAGAASTVVLALAVLVLAGALLRPSTARRGGGAGAGAATMLATPTAPCQVSAVTTSVACGLGGKPGQGSAVAPRATPGIAAATQTAPRAPGTPNASPGAVGAGCDNAAVTGVVERFLDAYNAGDQARLLAFFPAQAATHGHLVRGEERFFQWYSDTRKPSLRDEDGFAAYTRDELPPYWALRHAQHDRLQLRRFQDCDRNWDGNLAFVFELTRQADDLAMHSVVGKGEIDDAHGTIVLWGMGPEEQPATPTPAYSIPTTPDPRYRAPDLPNVTPEGTHGIPWITPSNPNAATGLPAITEQDVRAVALTAGFWPDQFTPVGVTTIASIKFLSHDEVQARIGPLSPTANDDLCLVTLAGGFTRPSPDPGATGTQGQPVTSQHLYLLFDARTGNFIMLAQPAPNRDQ